MENRKEAEHTKVISNEEPMTRTSSCCVLDEFVPCIDSSDVLLIDVGLALH